MKYSSLFLSLFFCLPLSLKADNYTISLPDYVCSGTPTGWTSTATGSGVSVRCASTGTTPPVGAPTGCVARVNGGTANISLSSAGGTAAMSVTCSTPSSGITYNWSRNGSFGENLTSSYTATFGANASSTNDALYNFQVRACNGTPCVTVPTTPLTVTVLKTSGGFNGSCPGFTATHIIPIDWSTPVRKYTEQHGGFGVSDIIIVKFTTGNVSTGSSLPRLTAAEYNSPPSSRTAVLSAIPCDFSVQSTPGATNIGNSITAVFALGTGTGFGYYPVLQLNKEYYLNMKNNPGSTCASAPSCDMFIELLKPGPL
jgi:hypothetical protein